MSKFKIINLMDKLFITCAVFLIIYGWLNFYLRDLWITFILSLIFSFSCLFVLNYFVEKKQGKALAIKKSIEEINNNFLAFRLYSKKEQLDLLNKILKLKYDTTLLDYGIIYKDENKKILLIISSDLDSIDNKNILSILSNYTNTKVDEILIVCNEVALNINKNIFKDKKIEFINKKTLYVDYFLKSNIYPEKNNINFSHQKLKFIDIVKNFFVPKKAKGYFFCGLILIFSSVILPYHFYYIIIGSTLLLFSVICKILHLIK